MNYKSNLIISIIILIGVMCTACGTEHREEVPGGSGNAVSDSAVNEGKPDDVVEHLDIELEKNKDHYFANKTSYFMETRDKSGRETGFDQMVKQGGERVQVRPKGFLALLGVTDEGVYYAREKGGSQDPENALLYRIPFGKGKSGKTKLETDKEELILEEPDGFRQEEPAYIDNHYIVYLPNMECVVKYNRKSEKKTALQMDSGSYSITAAGKESLILADPVNNDQYMYRLDLESDTLEQIWKDRKNLLDDVMLAHSGYLFCVRGDDVWAYDADRQKREKLLSREDILSACSQTGDLTDGQKPKSAYVEGMFSYNRKLYMQIQYDWKSGKEDRMGYAMFSMDFSDEERELVYDTSLSTCMRTRSTEQTHMLNPDIKWNSGRCHDITEDGRVILILNRKDIDEQQLGYYNISSREFKLISEDDKEYFISFMDSKNAFGTDNFELEKSYMAIMPDDLY